MRSRMPGMPTPRRATLGWEWAIGAERHAVAVVRDLQGHRGRIFAETDDGGVAAGMALDVGEAFLNDRGRG